MVIAVCSVALALWPERRRVAACVGSAGPTPIEATEAEDFISGALDWDGGAAVPEEAAARFGELVGAAARPIDDVRGSARYRSHAVGVLARRTLQWAWSELPVKLTINGVPRELEGAWGGESLLFALRERLGLPGSKNACEQGECGSCSVYLDGVLVCSCLVLAAQAEGRDVVTVEGLAPAGELHAVQEAFIDAGAVQCGFCTPGLIVASHDLLAREPQPSEAEIREALAGNVCRCTGYAKIVDAVQLAAERLAP